MNAHLDRPRFLTAEWRKLLMAQYVVNPAELAPWVPQGLELDLYEGHCFVSLVGFLFDRVRVRGVAIPLHTRFPEVNLRFYVRRVDADASVRRGVVFINEIVPRAAITLVANTFYEEPYVTAPMRHTIAHTDSALAVSYEWKRAGRWHTLSAKAAPVAEPIAPGSHEDFITEHYWGFTKRRRGFASQYEVRHPNWQIYPLQKHVIDVDFAANYGPAFAYLRDACPAGILLAEGSAVSVHAGTRVPADTAQTRT